MNNLIRRASILAGTTSLALAVGTGAAAAHVTVVAPDAAQGGYTVMTFRVPTESETAATSEGELAARAPVSTRAWTASGTRS